MVFMLFPLQLVITTLIATIKYLYNISHFDVSPHVVIVYGKPRRLAIVAPSGDRGVDEPSELPIAPLHRSAGTVALIGKRHGTGCHTGGISIE